MAESLAITDYKDLSKLRTKRPQNRDPARSSLRITYALDTETYEGNVFLIADSEGNLLDKITPEGVLKFLFHKRYQDSWNFFWNLGFDAEVILKLMGSELYRYKKTRKLSFRFGEFKIDYIPNRRLRIRKGHHSTIFFDIAQFYNNVSLVQAYEDNIVKLDDKYLQMKSNLDRFSRWFYKNNRNKVRNYCIQDCKLTKQLAEKWIKLFHDAFEFYPARWISSGYIAEKVLINNEIDIPKFNSIPYEIQELAFKSYFGGRFEILKRGFIGKAFLYDIKSAYPYALSQIPNLSKGRWIRKKSIHPKAKLGFFRIRANIPDCKYIPSFPFRVKNMIIFPSGRFETYSTLPELLACDDTKFYKILDSWQFIPDSDEYPYREFIKNLYLKRMELTRKKDPLQLPIKTILNSIYGKTGEYDKITKKIGNLFNPVIFATITGITRAQLYRFITDNKIEKQVVSFATDSIMVTQDLKTDSSVLGKFSFENSADDVFVLQNGINRMNGKWKKRGMGKLNGKEIENLENYEKNGRLYMKYAESRNTRLKTAINENRISDIGKFKLKVREINLNADRKRLWLGRIESIDSKTMNESMPISMNYFLKDEI